MKRLTSLGVISLALLAACGQKEQPTTSTEAATTTTAAAECGDVTVANMNWQSAEILAEVDKFILSEGYGCEVEIVAGDTMPTFTSMNEKAQPDIAPEIWVNAVREPLETAIKEGRLHYAAESLPDGAIEGWWIPKYIAEANPDIKTIDDALNRPDLFPSAEDPKIGAIHNCPSGWNCQLSTHSAYRAWGAKEKGFELVDTGSAAGLDGSIAKAYERKQGWLGYYWAPTSILGKYEMVKLDAGVPVDTEAFTSCNNKPADECANPVKTDWPKSEVYTVITDEFKKDASKAAAIDYLSKRAWGNDVVSKLMAWMTDNQATGEDGAKHFLESQADLWTQWVTPEAAEKIKAAL